MANKKQERAGRNDRLGRNARRKAGLPAKSGRRSTRKSHKTVKENFPLLNGKVASNTHGTVPLSKATHKFAERWKTGEKVMVSMTSADRQRLS